MAKYLIGLVFLTVFLLCCNSVKRTYHSKAIILDKELIEDRNDINTQIINQNAITYAVKQLEENGGGKLILPAGIYFIGINPDSADAAIIIKHDNIEIIGKGRDKTILKTNGTFKIVKGQVKRGHGILIEGSSWTADCRNKRKNIVLRGFQLDGQSGYTGNHSFPANINTGDGWDLSHKGIITNSDRCVDNIILEDLYVHSYKGEILYSGGLSTRKIKIRNVKTGNTNATCLNLYAAEMSVESCDFVGPAMMWMELTARKNLGVGTKNETEVKNCTFTGPTIANAGINLVQGDSDTHNFIFKNNTIKNSKGVFGFFGGVAGKVQIEKNILDSVGQALYFGVAPGYIGDGKNKNITFTNNKVSCSGVFAQFYHEAQNVLIKNNKVSGLSEHGTSVMYGNCILTNIVFVNSIFENMRQPQQNAPIKSGEKPRFYKNRFLDTIKKKQ